MPVIFKDADDDDQPVTLKAVLWASSAISSMLSVSQAVKGGCEHGVDEDGAWLSLPPPNRQYTWAEEEQGFYILKAKLQLASPAVISLSTATNNASKSTLTKEQVEALALQLHASLGHLNWTAVKQLLKDGAMSQVCKLTAGQVAAICTISKDT